MRQKLQYSLENLRNWTQRILENGRSNSIGLSDFISANSLNDFVIFYKKLIPFVNEVTTDLPHCYTIFEEFRSNLDLIQSNMRLKYFWFSFISDDFSYLRKQNISPLLENLEVSLATIDNVIYQLKINTE